MSDCPTADTEDSLRILQLLSLLSVSPVSQKILWLMDLEEREDTLFIRFVLVKVSRCYSERWMGTIVRIEDTQPTRAGKYLSPVRSAAVHCGEEQLCKGFLSKHCCSQGMQTENRWHKYIPQLAEPLFTLTTPAMSFVTSTWCSFIVCQAPKNIIYIDITQEFWSLRCPWRIQCYHTFQFSLNISR